MTGQARKQKHVPYRTCVVCREKHAKRNLVRVVRTADDGVIVDVIGKRSGRGAYLCTKKTCWEIASKKDVLDKALQTILTDEEREKIFAHGVEAEPRVID